MDPDCENRRCLLAVDLGLKTGIALYNGAGRLIWYRSQHFANNAALRRAVHRLLRETAGLTVIYLEGGGDLSHIWQHEAGKRDVPVREIAAETWRARLLYQRDQRNGRQAKRKADELARRVIEWSDAPKPKSLRHDASEAILIGLWGAIDQGWLTIGVAPIT